MRDFLVNLFSKFKLIIISFWYKCRKKNIKKIKLLKNIHKGERCFIIGNGPSLKVEDLNKLENEYTFVSNRFFTIHSKLIPTYYFMHDSVLLPKNFDESLRLNCNVRFYGVHSGTFDYLRKRDIDGILYLINERNLKERFSVSQDVSSSVNSTGSVSFSMLQFAIYMGFKEIYLLGFDHSFSKEIKNGKLIQNDDVKDHFSDYNEGISVVAKVDDMDCGFEIIKKYADENEIKIINSTRGGNLEVFPRIELEDVLN